MKVWWQALVVCDQVRCLVGLFRPMYPDFFSLGLSVLALSSAYFFPHRNVWNLEQPRDKLDSGDVGK